MRSSLGSRIFYGARIMVYICALLGVTLYALYFAPASVRYHVTESYRFSSTEDAGTVSLGVLLPASGPYQTVSEVAIMWDGDRYHDSGDRIDVVPTAVEALSSGVGGCEEFSNLMTALCRAAGIPAQTISGLYFPEILIPFVAYTGTWSHPAGAHAWVEFHADG